MLKTYLTLIFITFLALISSAQNTDSALEEEIIRNSKHYIWAEGIERDRDKARESANANLLLSIQADIGYSFTQKLEEDRTGLNEVTTVQRTSFTRLCLYGLQHLNFISGKDFRVFSYIHKDSLQASFDNRKHKILSLFSQARKAETELRIGDALREYYWAFLIAHTYPRTMQFESGSEVDPLTYLRNEVRRVLNSVQVESGNCRQEVDAIAVPLKFYYKGKPVQNIQFTYYCGSEGVEYGFVKNGMVEEYPLYGTPQKSKQSLTLSIVYAYSHEMRQEPDIKTLHQIFKEITFDNLVSVVLTFPWLEEKVVSPIQTKADTSSGAKHPSPAKSTPPQKWSTTVNIIAGCQTKSELFQALDTYLRRNRIEVGVSWEDLAGKGKKLYCVVFDNKLNYGVFYFDGSSFRNVKDGNTYPELISIYQGKKYAWFSESEGR
jgi:hypothetical protein